MAGNGPENVDLQQQRSPLEQKLDQIQTDINNLQDGNELNIDLQGLLTTEFANSLTRDQVTELSGQMRSLEQAYPNLLNNPSWKELQQFIAPLLKPDVQGHETMNSDNLGKEGGEFYSRHRENIEGNKARILAIIDGQLNDLKGDLPENAKRIKSSLEGVKKILEHPTVENTKVLQKFILNNLKEGDRAEFLNKNFKMIGGHRDPNYPDGLFGNGTLDGLNNALQLSQNYISSFVESRAVQEKHNSIVGNGIHGVEINSDPVIYDGELEGGEGGGDADLEGGEGGGVELEGGEGGGDVELEGGEGNVDIAFSVDDLKGITINSIQNGILKIGNTEITQWKKGEAGFGYRVLDGNIYVGNFDIIGSLNGKGVVVFSNGDKYEGMLRTKVSGTGDEFETYIIKYGEGKMIYNNGALYFGYYIDDLMVSGTFAYEKVMLDITNCYLETGGQMFTRLRSLSPDRISKLCSFMNGLETVKSIQLADGSYGLKSQNNNGNTNILTLFDLGIQTNNDSENLMTLHDLHRLVSVYLKNQDN